MQSDGKASATGLELVLRDDVAVEEELGQYNDEAPQKESNKKKKKKKKTRATSGGTLTSTSYKMRSN